MQIHRTAAIAALVLTAAALPAVAVAGDSVPSDRVSSHSHDLVAVQSADVPRSQAWGSARVKALPNGKLQVRVEAGGLAPGVHHMAHLHGFVDRVDGGCPGPTRDTSGDGLISVAEGAVDYGPVLVHLTTAGPTQAPVTFTDYPLADADGTISYRRTFPATVDHHRMAGRVQVVVHGIDLDGDGTVGAGLETSIPALCGGAAD